jgi:hypothetical protein
MGKQMGHRKGPSNNSMQRTALRAAAAADAARLADRS